MDNNTDHEAIRGMVQRDAHDTSIAAAEHASKSRESIKAIALGMLRDRGDMTDEELGDALAPLGITAESTPRKRRTDLYHEGLVIDSGARRLARSGRAMIVWHAVVDGELAMPREPEPVLDLAPVATSLALKLWRSWGMPERGLERSFAQTVEAVRAGLEAKS